MNRKAIYLLLFVLFFVSYSYFFQGGGGNQSSRVCLTRAILHERSFKIDTFLQIDPRLPKYKFVNTPDWSYKNGHYYTNKSPMLSILAVPPYGVAKYLSKKVFRLRPEKQIHMAVYFSTISTVALSATFLCLLLFHIFDFFLKFDINYSVILTIFFGFGTLFFPYSTTFYCHIPAAFFSFLAFVFAIHVRHTNSDRKNMFSFISGFSASTAVTIEPTTFLTLLIILIYYLSHEKSRKYAVLFFIGCIPPGIFQLFYNFMCFGNPLSSSYSYSNKGVMYLQNGRAFNVPELGRILQLLFLPYRGLFVSSPILFTSFLGLFLSLKKKKWVNEIIVCLTIFIAFFAFNAGFSGWFGGYCVGPRYLLPAFPFIYLLTIGAFNKFTKSFVFIGIISIIINLSITVVGTEISFHIKNPLTQVIIKNIIQSNVSINPIPFSNFENYLRLDDFIKTKNILNFNSFNLGELFFPYDICSLLPLLLFWAIWPIILQLFIYFNTRINDVRAANPGL